MSDVTADAPTFPPLLRGEPVRRAPLPEAVARARAGTDPGLILHRLDAERLSAAIVLAPEEPLGSAMLAVLALANGFADAFGALAPSEIAAQFDWPGGIRINGGLCGTLRAAAATRDPQAEPDWLVVGLDLALTSSRVHEPGHHPDRTSLIEEGCGDLAATDLLSAWGRHALYWIDMLDRGERKRLHAMWTGRAFGLNGPVTVTLPGRQETGTFLGLDETGGMILKSDGATRLLPLTLMLEDL
ncbi:biotin/lipoate--protein ligase family protein [Roseivivax isoporae]|uniref:Uncharacterized protein n=1 Tax=Roseivivax isoporae LMG 25204 TaxID=1449351 RepID=X7FBV4_9RHOB|nr:biotin/lipoate--protein ligase family protein [Roseivivax isoporae]ETX30300.1 hypothetical protein RISW2_15810 [Roseivivax isoporae LMG 25204]